MATSQHAQSESQGMRLVLLVIGLVVLALPSLLIFEPMKGLLFTAAAAVGVGGVVLLFYKPHLGVTAILAALIIDIDPIGIRFLSIPYLLTMVLLVPLTLGLLHDRDIAALRVPQVVILLAITGLFTISVVWNYFDYFDSPLPLPSETVRMLIILVGRFAFLVLFLYFITTRERIELTVWLAIGLVTWLAMDGLYGFVTKSAIHGHFGGDRAHASFSLAENANRLAYICLFGLSLLWFYHSHGKPRWWLIWLTFPLFFLLPLTVFTTGSRSGLLQTFVLIVFILKEQKGWSIQRRIGTLVGLGLAGLFVLAVAPSHDVERATSFNPSADVASTPGEASLRNRIATDFAALQIGLSHPLLGIGLGNFHLVEVLTPDIGSQSKTSNGYTWAMTSGGFGVLALYLLLFFLTYRALRRLESSGPPEFLWLSKGLKVNLFLFLLFSAFTDFWLSDFLYLLVAWPIVMTEYWRRQYQHSRQVLAAANATRIAQFAARRQRQTAPQIFSPSPGTSA